MFRPAANFFSTGGGHAESTPLQESEMAVIIIGGVLLLQFLIGKIDQLVEDKKHTKDLVEMMYKEVCPQWRWLSCHC